MGVDYLVYVIYGVRVLKEDYPQFYESDTLEELKEEDPEKYNHLELGKYDDYYCVSTKDFIIHDARKEGQPDSEYFYLGKLLFEDDAVYEFESFIELSEEDTNEYIAKKIKKLFGIDVVKENLEIKLWALSQYS